MGRRRVAAVVLRSLAVGEVGSRREVLARECPNLAVAAVVLRTGLAGECRTGLVEGLRTGLEEGLHTDRAAGLRTGQVVVLRIGLEVARRIGLVEVHRRHLVELEIPNLDPGAEVGRMPAAGGIVPVVDTGYWAEAARIVVVAAILPVDSHPGSFVLDNRSSDEDVSSGCCGGCS